MTTIDNLNNRVTPVDSIRLPVRFAQFASSWYGGMGCILYAVASVGTIKTGTNRPAGCNDQEWYYSLWRELSDSLDCLPIKEDDSDYAVYDEFRESVAGICEVLEYEYRIDCDDPG